MIVVVGQPLYQSSPDGDAVDGPATRIAVAAAGRGCRVQFVGKVGDDPEGDALVLALTRDGVGHSALLRDPGMRTPVSTTLREDAEGPDEAVGATADGGSSVPPTRSNLDPADVDLALRYLAEFGVLVLADAVEPQVVRVVAGAASWGEARLIVVVGPGDIVPDGLPPDAIVFEAPDADPDGVFAALVGSFAAALDDGGDAAEAFRASIQTDGWTALPRN